MTSTTSAVEPAVRTPAEDTTTPSRARSIPRAGWMVIASKEFGDHILSSRFLVLAIIMAVAAAVPLYFISGQIRDAPSGATGFPALFIALFWLTPTVNDQISLPSVVGFLALVGPLLGLAFSFDAINGERANGTLPRLLSQPIHRDDVINGKFAAGLAVIAMVVVVMILGVTSFALIRLGVVPEAVELLRIVLWILVTLTYIALWLAFGLLLSVGIRRAATSALVGFGTWLLLSFFGGLIVSLINGIVAPLTTTSGEDVLKNIGRAGDAPATPAGHAVPGGVTHVAQPAGDHGVDASYARAVRPGAAADPIAVLARSELHPDLAAGGRTRRVDRGVLRARLRAVHAPGGAGLGSVPC